VPVQLELAGNKQLSEAVNWEIGRDRAKGFAERMQRLNLRKHYNIKMRTLFSPETQWRVDYTGAQHGVDWRHPMPAKDEHGYVILNSVMSLFEHGTLPEQVLSTRYCEILDINSDYDSGVGVPFLLADRQEKDILAICCTQPYEQFPGSVTLKLDKPQRLEKLYLLTANLVKTLKCYYPGAELVVHYSDGTEQFQSLTPPYTMPSAVSNICTNAYAIRSGSVKKGSNFVKDRGFYLSVTDMVLDASKETTSIDLCCVATETMLGIVGATVLQAP
jgi:hypothetical protein